jgi:hypothetical protein
VKDAAADRCLSCVTEDASQTRFPGCVNPRSAARAAGFMHPHGLICIRSGDRCNLLAVLTVSSCELSTGAAALVGRAMLRGMAAGATLGT